MKQDRSFPGPYLEDTSSMRKLAENSNIPNWEAVSNIFFLFRYTRNNPVFLIFYFPYRLLKPTIRKLTDNVLNLINDIGTYRNRVDN